jgi:O-antigen/teichoic acid export membrane protein
MSASRKTLQTLAGHLLIQLQGLVLIPVVVKVSGPAVFGGYVLLLSYASIVFGVSSLGVGISAKRWLPGIAVMAERAARFYPQFWFQIASVTVLGLASVAMLPDVTAALAWHLPGFSSWMLLPYLLAYTLYSQVTDYFRYTHRLGIFNVSTVAQPYLFIALSIAVYWATRRLDVGVLVSALATACGTVGLVLFFKMYREMGIHCTVPGRGELGKELKLGLPLVLSYLVDVLLSGGDRYIIAGVMSIRDVGVYVPAYTLGSLLMVLPKVFGVVIPPVISQSVDAGDEAAAKKVSLGAARVFVIFSAPYIVGAWLVGKEVLRLYATAEIAETAWPVTGIVAVASVFYGLILIKSNILFVRLKTVALFRINLVTGVLNVALNIVLLKLFGNVIVAAINAMAAYIVSYVLVSRVLKADAIDFSLDPRWLLHVLVSAAGMAIVMVLCLSLLPYQGLVLLGLAAILGLVAYATLTLLHRPNRAELLSLVYALRAR